MLKAILILFPLTIFAQSHRSNKYLADYKVYPFEISFKTAAYIEDENNNYVSTEKVDNLKYIITCKWGDENTNLDKKWTEESLTIDFKAKRIASTHLRVENISKHKFRLKAKGTPVKNLISAGKKMDCGATVLFKNIANETIFVKAHFWDKKPENGDITNLVRRSLMSTFIN